MLVSGRVYLPLLPNCRQKITSPIVARRLVLSSAIDAQWDLQSGVRAGREHSAEMVFSNCWPSHTEVMLPFFFGVRGRP